MKIRTYLAIEGEDFSPAAFQSGLEPSVRGDVKFRKRMRNSVVERFGEYWRSPSLRTDGFDEAIGRFHELLLQLRPALLDARAVEIDVRAVLVAHFYDVAEVQGFDLPVLTVALLSEIGASFETDYYCHFEDEEAE